MIRFEHVTITYDGASAPTLTDVDLVVPEGELCLVAGRTGSGKSTLLGAINGLVPHFTGGRLAGRVTVDGRDTAHHPPRDLADVVGVVGQDPLAGFVTDTVEEELAYGMEQQAIPPEVMRRRVEETLDLLGIAELRGRSAALAVRRPAAAGRDRLGADRAPARPGPRRADVGARPDGRRGGAGRDHPARPRPRDDGRRGRAPDGAGGAVRRPDGPRRRRPGRSTGCPREVIATSPIAPPVVELGRLAGWSPAAACRSATPAAWPARCGPRCRSAGHRAVGPRADPATTDRPIAVDARGVSVRYGDVVAVREVDLDLTRRRGRRADGPQRFRQVVADVGAAGHRADATAGSVEVARRSTAGR